MVSQPLLSSLAFIINMITTRLVAQNYYTSVYL